MHVCTNRDILRCEERAGVYYRDDSVVFKASGERVNSLRRTSFDHQRGGGIDDVVRKGYRLFIVDGEHAAASSREKLGITIMRPTTLRKL